MAGEDAIAKPPTPAVSGNGAISQISRGVLLRYSGENNLLPGWPAPEPLVTKAREPDTRLTPFRAITVTSEPLNGTLAAASIIDLLAAIERFRKK